MGLRPNGQTDNPILKDGEPGYEADTGKLKIGRRCDTGPIIDYFLDQTATEALIVDIIGEGGGGGPHTHPETDITNLVTDLAAKAAHISSYEPHKQHLEPSFSH